MYFIISPYSGSHLCWCAGLLGFDVEDPLELDPEEPLLPPDGLLGFEALEPPELLELLLPLLEGFLFELLELALELLEEGFLSVDSATSSLAFSTFFLF